MAKPPAHRLRRRPGWFRPVPLRARHDGWSVARQCAFLVQLYLTGSVATAARSVGMSRASAYRLRARPEARSFAHAWDRVLTPPGSGHVVGAREDFRKVTDAELMARVESPLVKPVIYRRTMVGIREKPDISAILRLARRTGRDAGSTGRAITERCSAVLKTPPVTVSRQPDPPRFAKPNGERDRGTAGAGVEGNLARCPSVSRLTSSATSPPVPAGKAGRIME